MDNSCFECFLVFVGHVKSISSHDANIFVVHFMNYLLLQLRGQQSICVPCSNQAKHVLFVSIVVDVSLTLFACRSSLGRSQALASSLSMFSAPCLRATLSIMISLRCRFVARLHIVLRSLNALDLPNYLLKVSKPSIKRCLSVFEVSIQILWTIL